MIEQIMESLSYLPYIAMIMVQETLLLGENVEEGGYKWKVYKDGSIDWERMKMLRKGKIRV